MPVLYARVQFIASIRYAKYLEYAEIESALFFVS